jgi:CxxC motif-containing protein (DUF1111 family)
MKERILVGVLAISGVVVAQVLPGPVTGPRFQPPLVAPAPNNPGFGAPLAGLTLDEMAAFNAGREEFTSVETPEEGLGPIFNGRSCVQCHNTPAPGGASPITVTRFGRMVNGVFDPLESKGGSLLQRFAIDPAALERIPDEANTIAQRESTPIFGLGLVEAIPDAAILANAMRAKPDGVRGRAAFVEDVASGERRVGRFGWKGQHATLLSFSGDAYLNEMGITNRFFPTENAPNGNAALLAAFDRNADPEDAVDGEPGRGDVDKIADFMRLLAPPPRLTQTASARSGETLFTQVGCASCHVPTMTTGRHPVAALSEKTVNLYSDLLLHDMGSLNDGIAQAGARPNEMKTPPLWGLRVSAPYLHDGRAATIDQAIRAHDGEARRVRERYVGLAPALRQQILDFLNGL